MEQEEVKEMIRARHRICKHKCIDLQTVKDENNEKALTAQYHKKIKSFCSTYGKQGHKSTDAGKMLRTSLAKRSKNWKATKI